MKAADVHRFDQSPIVKDLSISECIPVDGFVAQGRGDAHVERQQIPWQDFNDVIEAISVRTALGDRSVSRLEGDEQASAEHHAMTTA